MITAPRAAVPAQTARAGTARSRSEPTCAARPGTARSRPASTLAARALAALLLAFALSGCEKPPVAAPLGGHDGVFTRGGIAFAWTAGEPPQTAPVERDGAAQPAHVVALAPGLVLVETPWRPGETIRVTLGGSIRAFTAPPHPSPVPVSVLDLGALVPLPPATDAESHVSICRLAPDGRSVLLGTYRGHVARVALPGGETVFSRRISDGLAKLAAWSADGSRVYVGEQTRDGRIHALDARTGDTLWTFRLGDDLGEGPPPEPDNPYAWVNHPGPYRMAVLPDGDLVVAGARSGTRDGRTASAARLYRLNAADGRPRWSWPPAATSPALPLNLPWFDLDDEGRVATILTAAPLGVAPPRESPLAAGSVAQIDLGSGTLLRSWTVPPLPPPLDHVHFWRSVAVAPDGGDVAVATQDGREFLLRRPDGPGAWAPHRSLRRVAPLEVSGLPVLATSGTLAATGREALFVFGDTYIPFAARRGEERPRSAHPAANTLYAVDWSGQFRWRWPMENFPNGIALDRARRWAALTFSPGASGLGGDRNGVALFDLAREGAGIDRFAWEYLTAGAIPYDQFDVSADGRWVVLVEVPYTRDPTRGSRGAFRLHVLH